MTIRGLSKQYEGHLALDGMDLETQPGEFIALLGPSGCGKTTTLRCLAGLEVPTAGQIQIGDDLVVDVEGRRFVPPNKRGIGMVFQSYALWPHMTVRGNVSYPLRLRGHGKSAIKARVDSVLAAVGLESMDRRFPHELSGGQQQRVALARGLVSATGLMLFDEPLSNLDASLRLAMRAEIRRLHNEYGHTSIFVTHDQAEALAIADRIVVMSEGRIEQSGTPGSIYLSPRTRFVAEFVGFENILDCVEVTSESGLPRVVLDEGLSVGAIGTLSEVAVGNTVAFRSTDVRLKSQANVSESDLEFRAKVLSSSFTGEGHHLVLERGDLSLVAWIPEDERDPRPEKYHDQTLDFVVPASAIVWF